MITIQLTTVYGQDEQDESDPTEREDESPDHWVVSDDGDDWDDETIDEHPDAIGAVSERVDHYRAQDLTVRVLFDGVDQDPASL
jgi:hypothetical protein